MSVWCTVTGHSSLAYLFHLCVERIFHTEEVQWVLCCVSVGCVQLVLSVAVTRPAHLLRAAHDHDLIVREQREGGVPPVCHIHTHAWVGISTLELICYACVRARVFVYVCMRVVV